MERMGRLNILVAIFVSERIYKIRLRVSTIYAVSYLQYTLKGI